MRTITLPIIAVLALAGCHRSRPVAQAPVVPAAEAVAAALAPTAELSLMGTDAVLWQNTSAEMYQLYVQAYEWALYKLTTNLADVRAKLPAGAAQPKYAVIVDIDETVLDNSPYQVEAIEHGHTFDPQEWKAWTDKAIAKPSPGALEFLKAAEARGCEVFYITNRAVEEKASTLKNLTDVGFPFADDAHLLLMEGASDKTARRAKVAATHRIVLLVGDQLRDFDERFKDRSVDHGRNVVDAMSDTLSRMFILLPNPMYGTYRDAVHGKGTDAEKLARMRQYLQANGH